MKALAPHPIRPAPLWREPHDAPTFTVRERRLPVLVVEDDAVQALILTLMLDHLGVAHTLVTDGAQAIEAVKTRPHALVLMDYQMPVLNGVEATRLIRCWERELGLAPVPIVAVTASGMADECRRYIEAGMNDVILKPFTAQGLAHLVSRYGPVRAGACMPLFATHGVTS